MLTEDYLQLQATGSPNVKEKHSTNLDQKLSGLFFLLFLQFFPEPLNDSKHPTNFLINVQVPEKPALNANANYRRVRTYRCLYSPDEHDRLKLCFQIQAMMLVTT